MSIVIPVATLKLIMCDKGDVEIRNIDLSPKYFGIISVSFKGMIFEVPVDTQRALEEFAKTTKTRAAPASTTPNKRTKSAAEKFINKKTAAPINPPLPPPTIITPPAPKETDDYFIYQGQQCQAILQTQRPTDAITKRRIRDAQGRKIWPVPVRKEKQ